MSNNKGKLNPREIKIQGLLDGFLKVKSNSKNLEQPNHIDEDGLTSFVEGNLTEREANPIVNHLVNCSYCRHITAELIKLDLAFADDEQDVIVSESEPTKVSEVLNGILTRIFGTSDGAVFAHQESDETDSKEGKESEEE